MQLRSLPRRKRKENESLTTEDGWLTKREDVTHKNRLGKKIDLSETPETACCCTGSLVQEVQLSGYLD